jgi:hypothetical protein
MARLSERPTADRDMSFLFRLARAGAASVRPVLETLAKPMPLEDDLAVRAAMHLARDHGQKHMRDAIVTLASARRDDGRGVVAAALWDLREADLAKEAAEQAEDSRGIGSVAWGALVRAACDGQFAPDLMLGEPTFRRVQFGWVE